MVLFYTIIFSYWSSEFYGVKIIVPRILLSNLVCFWKQNTTNEFMLIYLYFRFILVHILDSPFEDLNYVQPIQFSLFCPNSFWLTPRKRFFIVITSKEWQKTVSYVHCDMPRVLFYYTYINTTITIITCLHSAQKASTLSLFIYLSNYKCYSFVSVKMLPVSSFSIFW